MSESEKDNFDFFTSGIQRTLRILDGMERSEALKFLGMAIRNYDNKTYKGLYGFKKRYLTHKFSGKAMEALLQATLYEMGDNKGVTPLHMSAANGHLEISQLIFSTTYG